MIVNFKLSSVIDLQVWMEMPVLWVKGIVLLKGSVDHTLIEQKQ